MKTNIPAGLNDLQFEIYVKAVNIYAVHNGTVMPYEQFPSALLSVIDAVIELHPKAAKALTFLGLLCEEERRKKFISCNLANFDYSADLSADYTEVTTEYVNCNIRGTCPVEGKLCGPVTYRKSKISLRELKIMSLIRQGYLDKEIAEMLFASPETIKTTKRHLQNKLQVERKAMIAGLAAEMQIV